MAQRIVALDISPNKAIVVVFEASLRHAEIKEVKIVPLPPHDEVAIPWQHIKAAMPVVFDSLVMGVDGKHISTRLLHFPMTDLRKIDSAVLFELEGQIPYDFADIATTWTVAHKTKQNTSVLVAFANKGPLVKQWQDMHGAGLEPRAAMVSGAALAQFVPKSSTEAVAVLYLGSSQTHVAFCASGLRFVRTLRFGGDDIDSKLAAQFGISQDEARLLKQTQGRLLSPEELQSSSTGADFKSMHEALGLGLANLLSSFALTCKTLAYDARPKRLVLTGGGSQLVGLADYISRCLGLPVELLDMHERLAPFGKLPTHAGPQTTIAFGLALSMLQHGSEAPLNFRRGELAYHGDMQLYRGQFRRIAVGMAALCVLGLTTSVLHWAMLRATELSIDAGFCTATEKIVGRRVCDPTMALATLQQAAGESGLTIPSYSAAALFDMISKNIDGTLDVQFDEIDLRVEASPGVTDRITGKGEAASFEATEQLVSMLKRDVCVQDAEVSKLRKTQNSGRVEFYLQIKVACPAGVPPGSKQVG